ncbi:MAG: hypothetical protein ACK5ZH_06900 [Alphaproteobacteria bacterium]
MANATTLQSEMQGDAPVTVTRTKIHWGRVIKGAATITAIAVVAVVGYWFASSFFSTLLASNPQLAGAVAITGAAAKSIFFTVAQGIGIGLSAVGNVLGGFFTQLFPSLAGVGAAAAAAPAATAQTVGHGAGVAMAGAATAIGGLFALKHASAVMPMMTTEHHAMTPSDLSAYQAGKVAMKSAELAHHAAEHTQHPTTQHPARPDRPSNWTDRVPPPATGQASVAPRSASFTEQLNKEAATPISAEAKR